MDVGNVDRSTACPFLLRMFFRNGGHNSASEYSKTPASEIVPGDEMQIYTWADATLRELADLIREAKPHCRRPRCEFSFAIVYPDRQGKCVLKEVGRIRSGDTRHQIHDVKTLHSLHFQTGDYLDVAIFGSLDPTDDMDAADIAKAPS